MAKNVTIRDVAERAQVSPSAVTLALNGKAGVSEETRQRIQQIAQEMGYAKRRERPPLERRNIHYVVARKFFREEEAHVPHFHNLLMQSLEKHCRENNCFMVLHYVGSNEKDHDRVMDLIAGERDPMVVLQAADMPDDLLRRWQEAVPRLVALNKYFVAVDVNLVAIDNKGGISQVTEHLIRQGCTKIGRIRGLSQYQNIVERESGFQSCMRNHGLTPFCDLVVDTTHKLTYNALGDYIRRGEPLPEAFVTDGDIQANAAVHALTDAGLRVPEDVAVVGFDDLPFAATCRVPLTTCRIDWEAMARMCVWLLLNQRFGPQEHCLKVRTTTVLVPRQSA